MLQLKSYHAARWIAQKQKEPNSNFGITSDVIIIQCL